MPKQADRADSVSNTLRAFALLIVLALAGAILAFAWSGALPAQAEPAAPPAATKSTETVPQQTAIGAKCVSCHRPYVESFLLETHGKSAKFLNDSRAATCETCHGDGRKHIENREKRIAADDIDNPTELKTSEARGKANEACLQCHARDRSHFNWQGGQHDRSDMSCMSCHNVHHAKFAGSVVASQKRALIEGRSLEPMEVKSPENMLASFTVEETCLRCHADKRKALFQRSTHFFRTENRVMKVTCTSCHDPHGGEGRKMLQASTTNQLCYQCHAEKRGPLLWEHAPVRENCLTCHTPHGSNNANLLTTRTHQLCQQCHIHMLWRHQTVAGFDIFTFNKGCVNCHTLIHGSNHPAGKTFTR